MIEPILIAGLTAGIGGAAAADAWQTFERTCLAPMEALTEPDVADLTLENASTAGQNQINFYRDAEAGRLVQVMRSGDTTLCGVSAPAAEKAEVALAYTRWLEVVFGSRRYQTDGPFKVRSTDWRDPPLIIEYFQGGGDAKTTISVGEWKTEG